jgi:hypothetical protein
MRSTPVLVTEPDDMVAAVVSRRRGKGGLTWAIALWSPYLVTGGTWW